MVLFRVSLPLSQAQIDEPATLVTDESGGLDGPISLVFDSAGNLYVSSVNTDSILSYDSAGVFRNGPVPNGTCNSLLRSSLAPMIVISM
jgi:hypothetical protein